MTAENMLQLAKKHLQTALLLGLLLGAVSFLVLITTQKSFRSSTDLLLVQNQEGSLDYYAMSRSTDYLTSIITESIYSEKFLSEISATGKVSSSFLPDDKKQRLKSWQKMIVAKKNSSVGILSVEIFGDTQSQTREISEGVLEVLINKNSLFLGKGQNLEIRVLSGPIIEKNPSIPQIAITSVGGFVMGIILTFLFVFYREELFKREESDTIEISRVSEHNFLQNSPYDFEKRENQEIEIKEDLEINNPEYLSEDSEYWKERLNNKS